MKRFIVLLFCFALLLTACSSEQESTPTKVIKYVTATPAPTNTPMPTPTEEPHGPRIAFSSNRGADPNVLDVCVMDVNTGEITVLNTGFNAAHFPKWSPDGSRIMFVVEQIWNLYTIKPDGSELTQLTDFRSNNADWSPDGSQIVFQSDHQNEPVDTPDLYIMDLASGALTEILDQPEIIDYSPRWSPDGETIMFLSQLTGKYEIYTMNTDGSDMQQVSDTVDTVFDATWSPDGSRIAVVYGKGNLTDIYVMDPDGISNVVRLTANKSSNNNPSFTPDGQQLLFSSNMNGNLDLYIINVDGSNLIQLTDDEYYDAYPDWSP